MELRHLQYFLSVADDGGYASAAKRLGLAASTLYRRIGDLEAELGAALFIRREGEVKLSAAGELLADHARRIVSEAHAAVEDLRSLSRGKRGVVRLGFNGVAAHSPVVAEALRRARALLPDLDLKIHFAPSQVQVQMLRRRELDLGFAYQTWPRESDLGFVGLERQRFVLVLPIGHPLCERQDIRLKDLAHEPFIFQGRLMSGPVHDRLLAACSAGGLVPRIVREIVEEDAQMELVATGVGVSLAPDSASARRWREAVTFRPVVDLDVAISLDLVWGEEPVADNAARMIGVVKAVVGEQAKAF